MKISYTIIILLIITIQVYSQKDSTEKQGLYNKYKEFLNDDVYKQQKIPQDIIKEYLNKSYGNKYESHDLQIIPIPPARKENSLIELLPLYKQGDRLVKFLRK